MQGLSSSDASISASSVELADADGLCGWLIFHLSRLYQAELTSCPHPRNQRPMIMLDDGVASDSSRR